MGEGDILTARWFFELRETGKNIIFREMPKVRYRTKIKTPKQLYVSPVKRPGESKISVSPNNYF